jgi:ATP-binding cassette subfamily B protein
VSSIASADKILVLTAGKILAVGTHQELLESCPTYAEIHQSQMGGAILD